MIKRTKKLLKNYHKALQEVQMERNVLKVENNQLKKELAEKEKEIEKYKQLCTISKLEDLQIENMLLKGKHQDKISFAVEQFQELKKSLRDKVCLMENDEHCYPQNAIHWQDIVAIIVNKIKQLKEGE